MLALYASFSTLAVEYVPNCKSINPLVTSQWCNDNCNHIPAFCPANLCLCNTGVVRRLFRAMLARNSGLAITVKPGLCIRNFLD